MNWIITSLISTTIITVLWIRTLRQLFWKTDKKRFFLTSITSVISVFVIASIYKLANIFTRDKQTITIIYTVLAAIVWLLYIQKKRFAGWIMQSILWILLSQIGGITAIYSISALGEESFKWIYIKKFVSWLLGEIILLAIVSGIVFGRTENLIYIITSLVENDTNSKILALIQQRWILPLIVHIGSLCISLMVWFTLKWKISTIPARSLALWIWIGSHYLFNISQVYQAPLATTIIIVLYLIIISYSLFRSDILYSTTETK